MSDARRKRHNGSTKSRAELGSASSRAQSSQHSGHYRGRNNNAYNGNVSVIRMGHLIQKSHRLRRRSQGFGVKM